jgi:polysaccharide deacetylase 2 family uncharacterized protein YibQ
LTDDNLTNGSDTQIAPPEVALRVPPVAESAPQVPEEALSAPQIAADPVPDLSGVTSPPQTVNTPMTAPLPQAAAPSLGPQPGPLASLDADAPQTSPQMTAPMAPPQAGAVGDLTVPRPLPQSVTARAGEDAPVLPNPQALAPMIPDDSLDARVETDAPLPDPIAPQQAPEQDPVPGESAETEEDQAPQQATVAPRPRVLPAPESNVATQGTDLRPRVGRPATSIIDRAEQDADTGIETVTQAAPDDPADLPPLRRYAQPFDNADAKPLMSIVLMDNGADLDAAAIGLPALTSFPYPVSFAVDAALPDAFERMERYRAEGFDVLAMVDLPQGARASDAEVSLAVALSSLPEIVGILEGTGEGLQGSREVSDQVTGILRASGHGLVTQNRGLNSMPKLAVKEGVAAAPVFRDFDSEGQTPRIIRRFLDQAAFKAGQETGGVIMLGRLRPETIEALLVWGLADRAGTVALAPVSAVLLAQ